MDNATGHFIVKRRILFFFWKTEFKKGIRPEVFKSVFHAIGSIREKYKIENFDSITGLIKVSWK